MGACVPVGTSSCGSRVGVNQLLVRCVLEVEMCRLLHWLLIVWKDLMGLGESALVRRIRSWGQAGTGKPRLPGIVERNREQSKRTNKEQSKSETLRTYTSVGVGLQRARQHASHSWLFFCIA